MQKADKNIVEKRIKEIVTKLINGNSREEIILYSSENWNVGERQTDKYIARAKDLVEKSVKRKIEYDYAKAVSRYENLYKLCLEKKDYRTALNINKELTQLQNLLTQNLNHNGEIKFICNIPD